MRGTYKVVTSRKGGGGGWERRGGGGRILASGMINNYGTRGGGGEVPRKQPMYVGMFNTFENGRNKTIYLAISFSDTSN